MRRIGDILVEHGFVTNELLERALAKQREIPRRLCSLLVALGIIDVDQASRALGEQHGCAAVLAKHLEGRDDELAALVPAELARSLTCLPIGRLGTGELIVCVRDPQPSVLTALAAVIADPIVLAVAPACQIEPLVAERYGTDEDDFDVDLTTGPLPSLELDPIEGEDVPPGQDPLGGLGALTLVGLDDNHVTKDPTQSGSLQLGALTGLSAAGIPVPTEATAEPVVEPPVPEEPVVDPEPMEAPPERPSQRLSTVPGGIEPRTPAPTTPPPLDPEPAPRRTPSIPPASRPRGPSTAPATIIERVRATTKPPSIDPRRDPDPPAYDPAIALGTPLPRKKPTSLPQDLLDAYIDLATAPTVEEATALAMQLAASRWRAAILLEVRDKTATGEAGAGRMLTEDAIAALAIPLATPSIVSAALEAGVLVTAAPDNSGPAQDRLDALLGVPRFPSAIAIAVGGQRTHVLVAGDAIHPAMDALELGRLASALGDAYERLSGRSVTPG